MTTPPPDRSWATTKPDKPKYNTEWLGWVVGTLILVFIAVSLVVLSITEQ